MRDGSGSDWRFTIAQGEEQESCSPESRLRAGTPTGSGLGQSGASRLGAPGKTIGSHDRRAGSPSPGLLVLLEAPPHGWAVARGRCDRAMGGGQCDCRERAPAAGERQIRTRARAGSRVTDKCSGIIGSTRWLTRLACAMMSAWGLPPSRPLSPTCSVADVRESGRLDLDALPERREVGKEGGREARGGPPSPTLRRRTRGTLRGPCRACSQTARSP
jgi:hypothetical protein